LKVSPHAFSGSSSIFLLADADYGRERDELA
jgi:hypothetical protein